MEELYEQFIKEKLFLDNVTQGTADAYRWAWKALEPALKGQSAVTKANVLDQVAALRSRGLSSVTVNTYLRSINTFCTWLFAGGHSTVHLKIPRLREEQMVIEAFSPAQIEKLIAFRGTAIADKRGTFWRA